MWGRGGHPPFIPPPFLVPAQLRVGSESVEIHLLTEDGYEQVWAAPRTDIKTGKAAPLKTSEKVRYFIAKSVAPTMQLVLFLFLYITFQGYARDGGLIWLDSEFVQTRLPFLPACLVVFFLMGILVVHWANPFFIRVELTKFLVQDSAARELAIVVERERENEVEELFTT